MPFPVEEARIEVAERELGRRLPPELRQRLMRDNGGEVTAMPVREDQQEDFDPHWDLHPVWDDSDRRRASRTASHIVLGHGRASLMAPSHSHSMAPATGW